MFSSVDSAQHCPDELRWRQCAKASACPVPAPCRASCGASAGIQCNRGAKSVLGVRRVCDRGYVIFTGTLQRVTGGVPLGTFRALALLGAPERPVLGIFEPYSAVACRCASNQVCFLVELNPRELDGLRTGEPVGGRPEPRTGGVSVGADGEGKPWATESITWASASAWLTGATPRQVNSLAAFLGVLTG